MCFYFMFSDEIGFTTLNFVKKNCFNARRVDNLGSLNGIDKGGVD